MTINQVFVEVFEPTMKAAGFARKGKVFHRIVNGQIVQLLSYTKFSGPDFTIQFSIAPLYLGFEWSTLMDATRLSELFPDVPTSWVYGWETDEYKQIMPRALEQTKEKLFPLFETIIDNVSYMEHEKLAHTLEPPAFADSVFKQHLIQKNYENAKRSREALFTYWKEMNQKRWGTDTHTVSARQAENDAIKTEFNRLVKAINAGDETVIAAYVRQEVQKSLDSYVRAFSTPKKYEKYQETGLLPIEFMPLHQNETSMNTAYQNHKKAETFRQQLLENRNAFNRLPYNRNPYGYQEKSSIFIQGVKYFGFSEGSDLLYIDSTTGRVLVDLSNRQIIVQNEPTNDEQNAQQLMTTGFDVLEGQPIKLACKYGESLLPITNPQGDRLLCGAPYYNLVFQPAGEDCLARTRDYSKVTNQKSCRIHDGEFYGFGFSFSGKYFVIGCEDAIWIWELCENLEK